MTNVQQRKMRPLFAYAARCELDGQGRILLPQHLRALIEDSGETPSVNQIEVHPRFNQPGNRAFCAANGVDLREPLKPTVPADCQEITLP